MKRPIDYRPPDLVTAILNLTLDDEDPKHSIPEPELLELLDTGAWNLDTIRRTIRELVDFGAIVRAIPLRQHEHRIRLSTLGRAWLNRELEPYVRNVTDVEETEDPVDDLDLD